MFCIAVERFEEMQASALEGLGSFISWFLKVIGY